MDNIYVKIQHRLTYCNHNLIDVCWPSLRSVQDEHNLIESINCGVIAPDFDVYVLFQEFLNPILKDIHGLDRKDFLKTHPQMEYFPIKRNNPVKIINFSFNDDMHTIKFSQIECSRNLYNSELPLNLNIVELEQLERLILTKIFTKEFTEAIKAKQTGKYYTLAEILKNNSKIRQLLEELNLMIKIPAENDTIQKAENFIVNGRFWPYARGVYVIASCNLALWINCQEHLRILISTSINKRTNIGIIYERMAYTMNYLEQRLHFKESAFLGYLQSRPAYLGTGLKFKTTLKVSNLIREINNLRHLCFGRGLHLEIVDLSKHLIRLINMQSLAKVEHAIFMDYCTAVTNIIFLEKNMCLANSKEIAKMLIKIFSRKQ